MEKTSFARRFLNAILAFLFAVSVFVVIAVAVMNTTVFSPDFYVRQIDACGFSENVLGEMQEAFNDYTSAFNVPDSFVTDRITLDQIDEAIKQTITAEFNNTAPYDYSVFRDRLVDDLQNYVETELGLPVDVTGLMADFDSEIEEVFAQYFETTAFSRVAKFSRTYGPLVQIGQWVFGAVAVILLALLLRLSINRSNRLRSLTYAFGALVLFNGICFCARFLPVRIFLNFLNMNLARESVRLLVIQCINSAISAFTWPLIVSAAILVILIIFYSLGQRTAKRGIL